jgi:hypothetical protein
MMDEHSTWPQQRRAVFLALLITLMIAQLLSAQVRYTYSRGQSVSPAYEGWMLNDDGSFTLYFGYMNTNWEEQFDVPIGPDNSIEPGGPDQGQPTHFYPRRNPFLFTIRVPKDHANQELIWTLTTHGRTRKAYASLKPDYRLDKQGISMEVGGARGSQSDRLRENLPPELIVEGTKERTVIVGERLTLIAVAGDPDNFPPRSDGKPAPGWKMKARETGSEPRTGPDLDPSARQLQRAEAPNSPNVVYAPPPNIRPESGPGLRLSWIVYRGKAAAVSLSPDQFKTWTDTRSYANSPWSPPYSIPEPPPGGKWVVQATFQEPGAYVLRAVASDSSLFTYENVTVNVRP